MTEVLLRLVGKWLAPFAGVCLGLVAPTFGEDVEFAVTWSGFGLGNTATAEGIVKIDDTVLLNPGSNSNTLSSFVVDFRMTVSGASAGNGNFGLADFSNILLQTGPGNPGDLALDFGQELVGQDTGTDPWGTQSLGDGGDFRLFPAGGMTPLSVSEFKLCANGGAADCMDLTSFEPIHTAWLKLKVQTKGVQITGSTLLGKAKAKGTCYLFLQWEGLGPAGGPYYCETTPGDWEAIGGAGAFAWNAKSQLLSGSCGLATATGSLGGPGFFSWSWAAEMDGALKSAKLRTVGGYMAGTLDGNDYFGDCKISGSTVAESKVPPEVVAVTP